METIRIRSLNVFMISILVVVSIRRVHGQYVNITIVQNAVGKGAVCLDGSPAGYHYSVGYAEGANNWMIYLPGGGWCGSTENCLKRVQTQPDVASTTNITKTYFGGILSLKQNNNPDFYNWNKVYIIYCDGSSFLGDVEEVDPETNLHYRGSRIFAAVVDELLPQGLNTAQNVILAGNSAGGLATILKCDRFKALVPNAARLKCLSDSGFFIRAKDLPNVEQRELTFANVVALHEVAKFLAASCTSKMDPSLCFFPENLVGDIQTPLFLLNSAFDRFQISANLKPYAGDEPGWKNCTANTETCTPAQSQLIKDFRSTFLKTLKDSVSDCPTTGMFINACYIHDYIWATTRWNSERSPRLENKTIAQVVGDWYFDRSIVKLIDTQTNYPVECHV